MLLCSPQWLCWISSQCMPMACDAEVFSSKSTEECSSVPWFLFVLHPLLDLFHSFYFFFIFYFFIQTSFVKQLALSIFHVLCLACCKSIHSEQTPVETGVCSHHARRLASYPHILQCLSSEHLLYSLSWVLSHDSSRAESPAAGPRADLHFKLGPVATSTSLRRVSLDQTCIG